MFLALIAGCSATFYLRQAVCTAVDVQSQSVGHRFYNILVFRFYLCIPYSAIIIYFNVNILLYIVPAPILENNKSIGGVDPKDQNQRPKHGTTTRTRAVSSVWHRYSQCSCNGQLVSQSHIDERFVRKRYVCLPTEQCDQTVNICLRI